MGMCAELQYLSECRTRRELDEGEYARYLELKKDAADQVAWANDRKRRRRRFGGAVQAGAMQAGDGGEELFGHLALAQDDCPRAIKERSMGVLSQDTKKAARTCKPLLGAPCWAFIAYSRSGGCSPSGSAAKPLTPWNDADRRWRRR